METDDFPAHGDARFGGWRSGMCGQGGKSCLERDSVAALSACENLLTSLTHGNGVCVRRTLISAPDLFLSHGSLCRETCSKITRLSFLH